MSISDWIKKYEGKTEPFIIQEGEELYFTPEHGFIVWRMIGDTLYIDHTSTDDVRWAREKCREIGKAHGATRMFTFTLRNPRAFQKITGAHFAPQESRTLANGVFYWAFEDVI